MLEAKRCSFSVLGSRKSNKIVGFFQVFPLPWVKRILQEPSGSGLAGGVTAAAPSPGQAASPAPISPGRDGCCVPWVGAAYPRLVPSGMAGGSVPPLPGSPAAVQQDPGGRRALDCTQLGSFGRSLQLLLVLSFNFCLLLCCDPGICLREPERREVGESGAGWGRQRREPVGTGGPRWSPLRGAPCPRASTQIPNATV